MKGARKYHRIIKDALAYGLGGLEETEYAYRFRKGNVEFILSEHARGKTFRIELIDGASRLEVYGVVRGQTGWDEEYGWTRKGTWVKPILEYLHNLEREIAEYEARLEEKRRAEEAERNRKIEETVDRFNEIFKKEVSL